MSRLLRAIIRRFDAFLCRIYKVYEFNADPDCILRLAKTQAQRTLQLPGGLVIQKGDPVLEIHLWNEHMTRLSESEDSMVWASRTYRQLLYSLRLVARQVKQDAHLADVHALMGITSALFSEKVPNRPSFMERLGFTIESYHGPLGAFGEFWENFYAWWIMWTYNPYSLRSRRLLGIRRNEIWMPINELMQRYGMEKG